MIAREGVTIRRAIATVLFGIVAIMAIRVLLTRGLNPDQYLTAALVFATAVSGWFVVETVVEMRVAREASFRPILIPFVRILDHEKNTGQWGVRNVGLGPALEVNVSMRYGQEYGSYTFTFEGTLIDPGEERHVRIGSGPRADKAFHPDLWRGRTFTLKGTCKDVRGVVHQVNTSLSANEGWTATVSRENPIDAHGNPIGPETHPPEGEIVE